MNAYVKAALQSRVLVLRGLPFTLTKMHALVFGLALAVLLSAFSLVYVKDMNRRLMNRSQSLQSHYVELHSQWSQLLVARGNLASQSRVAEIAAQKLHMVMPKPSKIVMIRA